MYVLGWKTTDLKEQLKNSLYELHKFDIFKILKDIQQQ